MISADHYAPSIRPRGVLRLGGDDRMTFLQGLVSNDMRLVAPDRAVWTALLSPQGKYLFDFFVIDHGDAWLLDGDGARIGALRSKLLPFRLRSKVTIDDVTDAVEIWQGWGASALGRCGLVHAGAAAAAGTARIVADPRDAALGVRVIAERDEGRALFEARGFVAGDPDGWERLRIAAGVPDGPPDLEIERTVLLEAGFDRLNGVSFDKGCYMGQELTARTHYRGLVKRRLLPVRFSGAAPVPGTPVVAEDGAELGTIRSGIDGLALASVRLEALEPGCRLAAGGQPIEVADIG